MHTEFRSQFFDAYALGAALANGENFLIRELYLPKDRFANRIAPFLNHIANVRSVVTKEKVIGPNTSSMIALMAQKAVGRQRAVSKEPR